MRGAQAASSAGDGRSKGEKQASQARCSGNDPEHRDYCSYRREPAADSRSRHRCRAWHASHLPPRFFPHCAPPFPSVSVPVSHPSFGGVAVVIVAVAARANGPLGAERCSGHMLPYAGPVLAGRENNHGRAVPFLRRDDPQYR